MEHKELRFQILLSNDEVTNGEPVYLFNADRFVRNFVDLQTEFRKIYPNTRIAYSYKTNHIPGICKLVDTLGGYAEVVSSTEADLAYYMTARNTGRVIFNGLIPGKYMADILKFDGKVNVESWEGLKCVLENAEKQVKIGIRIGEEDSRFGFLESELFKVLSKITEAKQTVAGIHCHVGGSRSLQTWKKKTERMLRIARDVENILGYPLEYIDLGGHLFGRMDEELKKQFGDDIPTFREYAETVATLVRDTYEKRKSMPQLILEPGTALIADAVSILATVQNVKIRGMKRVATLDVSSHDCGMIADYKNLTVENISAPDLKSDIPTVICGYTCMEEDYINREYMGWLKTGDRVLIHNCGAYSMSMKGNFIFPMLAMYMVNDNYEIQEIMRERGQLSDITARCAIGGIRCAT